MKPFISQNSVASRGGILRPFGKTMAIGFSSLALIFQASLLEANPFSLAFTGRLTDSSGVPVTGSVDLVARFYDSQGKTTQKHSDIFFAATNIDANGQFTLNFVLTSSEYQTIFGDGSETWIEIENTTHAVTYPVQKFSTVPYALQVPVDDTTVGFSPTGQLQVEGLAGASLPSGTPSDGEILKWQDGTGWVWSSDLNGGGAGSISNAEILDGTIEDQDISATAAIAGSKINPNFGSQNIVTTGTISGDGSLLTNLPAGPLGGAIDSSEITDGAIVDDDIAATAAIDVSKISGLGSLATLSSVGTLEVTDGALLNDDIAATAAIAGSKINPDFGAQNIVTTGTIAGDGSLLTNLPTGPLGTSIDSSEIVNGVILDEDIAATAAISTSKISGLGSLASASSVGSAEITDGEILDEDIAATAAISGSKVIPNFGSQNIVTTGTISGDGSLLTNLPAGSLGTSIDSSEIVNGEILDEDIAATAAIASSKIAGLGSLATASAVGSAEITDGEILNDDIAATAAISGSKVNPDFGAQNIVTTGTISGDGSLLTNLPAGSLGTSIDSSEIVNGEILDEDIAATAAISGSKISPNFGSQNIVTTGTITGDGSGLTNLPAPALGTSIDSSEIENGEILDEDIAATAAISGSKVSPNFGAQNIVTTGTISGDGSLLTNLPAGALGTSIDSSEIVNGEILDEDIAATAAIANSKIAGLGSLATASAVGSSEITDGAILNDDIAATAAISGSKISPNFGSQNIVTTGTITGDGSGLTNLPAPALGTSIDSSEIENGEILDEDIAATAAIANSKIAGLGALATASSVGSSEINNGEILDEDIAATAAISGSKISPNFGSQNIVTTGTISGNGSGLTNLPAPALGTSIDSSEIENGEIIDEDIAATAAIANSKIAGLGALATASSVGSSEIDNGEILDEDIAATAAIANSKIAGLGALATASSVGSSEITNGEILNEDIAATAAISGSKISPNFGSQNIVTTGTISGNGSGLTNLPAPALGTSIDSSEIENGVILDEDIAATAAIANSKIAGLGSLATQSAVGSSEITNGEILNEDIAATAAIAGSKISPNFGSQNITTTGTISGNGSGLTNLPAGPLGTTIDSSEIVDGSITNDDVAATAAIANSKIAGLGSLATKSALNSSDITDGSILNEDIAATASLDAAKIGNGSVSTSEFQYLSSVTSDIQSQIDSKAPSDNPVFSGVISVPSGSAGAPGYTFVGDSDTGMRQGGANKIQFTTNGFNRMLINSDGKIGLNQNAPKEQLHLEGNILLKTYRYLSSNLYYDSGWKYVQNGYGMQMYFDGVGGVSFISAPNNTSGNDAAALIGTKLILTNDGKLGFGGITAPKEDFHTGSNILMKPEKYLSSNLYYDSSWKYDVNGYGMLMKFDSSGAFVWESAGNNSSGNDAAASVSTKMTLANNGRLGIGVTNPSHILHINGQGRSTNSSWTTTSDIRLKDVVRSYDYYGLKDIDRIKPIIFQYKDDNPLDLPSEEQHVGIVAQELNEIIPEAVNEGSDGYLNVNIDPVIWAMVNAIKELSEKTSKLESENKALKEAVCQEVPNAELCL